MQLELWLYTADVDVAYQIQVNRLIASTELDPDTGSACMYQFPSKNVELNTCFFLCVFSLCI